VEKNYKQLTAIKSNVESSRSLIFLYTVSTENEKTTIKLKGKLSEKDWAILDTVFTNFISQEDYGVLENPIKGINLLSSGSLETIASQRDITKPLRYNCVVSITGEQIRRTLGDSHFSDAKIDKTIEELRGKLDITVENVKIWKENDKFEKLTCNMSFIRKVGKKETGKLSCHKKDVQYEFQILLEDEAAVLFSNDALQQNFLILDDTFYKLKGSNRKMIRYLSLWRNSNISLTHFAKIEGWKVNSGRLRNYIERAEGILGEIKEDGYITDWWRVKGKRGIKTQWEIRGIKIGITNELPALPVEIERSI